MQALFNLIVSNQIHYHLTFALITLLFRSLDIHFIFAFVNPFFSGWWFRLIRHNLHPFFVMDERILVGTSIYGHI